jgi:hypothetical protein
MGPERKKRENRMKRGFTPQTTADFQALVE